MPQWIYDVNNPRLEKMDLVTSIMVMTARLTQEPVPEFYRSRTHKAFLLKSKVRRKLLSEGFTLKQVAKVEEEVCGKKTHHATIIHSRDTSLKLIEKKHPQFNEQLEKELEDL